MKHKTVFLLFLGLVALCGCSYSVPATLSPAVNIYSSYEGKIPGTVVLVVDDNVRNFTQNIKASSYVCSAHHFPVTLGSSLADSIRQTSESMFENVVEQSTLPTSDQLNQLNAQGVIYLRLNRLSPRISFSQGFWSSDAHASCDTVLDITIKDATNKALLVTCVSGSRTVDGDGGGACGNGAIVLGDAVSQSITDAMERYAERVSNSQRVRNAFTVTGSDDTKSKVTDEE